MEDLRDVRREEAEVDDEEAGGAGSTSQSGFFHSIRTTTNASIVSIASVPVTAMP